MSSDADLLIAPDCASMTVEACVKAFADAGFTSTPRIIWENGAKTSTPVGHVTATTPGPGVTVPRASADHPVGIAGAGLVVPDPKDLEDSTLAQYEAMLTDAGFTSVVVDVVDRGWLNRGQNWVFNTHYPRPGTAIDPDQVDAIWVRVQVDPYATPDLTD